MLRPKLPIFSRIFLVVFFYTAGVWNFPAIAQSGSHSFEYLQEKFPELESYIGAISMDPQGFIWFGGETLIQRYDGNTVKTYPIRSMLEQSGEKIQVSSSAGFLTDSFNNFWVFSNVGLFLYNPACDCFTRVSFNPPVDFFYKNGDKRPDLFSVKALMEDVDHNLWVGLQGGILFYFPISAVRDILDKATIPPEKMVLPDSTIVPVWYQLKSHTVDSMQIGRNEYLLLPEFRHEVFKLLQDRDGDIWVNSYPRIFRLVQRNGRWEYGGYIFKNSPTRFGWTKNVFLDKDKNFWVGVGNYLALKREGKPLAKDIQNIPNDIRQTVSPYGNDSLLATSDIHFDWYEFPHLMGFQGHTGWIDNVYCGSDNRLIVTNEHSVLSYSLELTAEEEPHFSLINQFQRNINDPGTYWKVDPNCMFLTEEKVIFSGDWSNGVVAIDLSTENSFRKLYHIDGDENSLPKMTYSSIQDLGKGRILIGGSNNNLYLTDSVFSTFKKIPLELSQGITIDNMIQTTIPDGFGRIWVRNYIGQLAVFRESYLEDPEQTGNSAYQFKQSNFESPGERLNVIGIDVDTTGVVWVACANGIYFLDLKKISQYTDWEKVVFQKFNDISTLADSLAFQDLRYLIPIKPDFNLLISGKAAYQFDPLSRQYWELDIKTQANEDNPILKIWFYQLANDGTLWTSDMLKTSAITFHRIPGSSRYQVKYKNYTAQNGFPRKAYEFVADDHNNLWIYPESSEAGIVRFSPSTNTFSYYNSQGIISGAVFGGLHGKDRSGRIYLGALDGITVFHPDSVKLNEFIPPIRITDIKILHKSVYSDPEERRLWDLFSEKILTLKASENVLNIEFSSLSYANPGSNRYAYFLAGFDKDTIFTDASNRMASYSNLAPGTYEFFVTGSNNNLAWSKEGAQLKIIVLPPWYATWYAYSLYLLTTVGLIVWWRRYDVNRLRLAHKAELEHAEAEKLRELDRTKSEFFSNISHEFRTPLTLILGPLEGIIRNASDSAIKNSALMMRRNARRLHRLINQILDLSMLDSGKLQLRASCSDLPGFVRQIVANFESAALDKSIALRFKMPENPLFVYFDGEKLEDILDNLLENSLKFTPAGGEVLIEIRYCNELIWYDGQLADAAEITISDTGKGIPADQVLKIFDRFYQVDASHTRKHEGAGIGLTLVHELVLLHKGTINVQSIEGEGTTFAIRLRMGNLHLRPEEIVILESDNAVGEGLYSEDDALSAGETLEDNTENLPLGSGLPMILVVENNADMRQYIMQHYDHQYTFIEAEDGHQGFVIAIRAIPDLIISDLMMPVMDGYELCSKLRADERTRHIPVIILTAKAGKKHQIMGYDCGADDYVTKPFEQDLLLARIKNLLRERKMLAEKFSLAWAGTSSEDHITTADENFIQRLNAILEKQYSDPEFGTNVLTREAGFSHSVLYRKLKSLTNHSPNAYIRNYRLIKAHELLSNKHADISTVAYLCGFNNLSYFSKCYRQFFNRAPHEDYTLSSGK